LVYLQTRSWFLVRSRFSPENDYLPVSLLGNIGSDENLDRAYICISDVKEMMFSVTRIPTTRESISPGYRLNLSGKKDIPDISKAIRNLAEFGIEIVEIIFEQDEISPMFKMEIDTYG